MKKTRWSIAAAHATVLCFLLPNWLMALDLDVKLIGRYANTNGAQRVVISGNYACVLDLSNSLQVINIANPAMPQREGACEVSGARDIAVFGNYVCVASQSGLEIVDIGNPTNPRVAARYSAGGGRVEAVALSGTYAYVAAGFAGLQVIDFSDLANLRLVQVVDFPDSYFGARDVTVSGTYAYVATDNKGLHVFDIGNPGSIRRVGGYDHSDACLLTRRVFAVSGNCAYVEYVFGGCGGPEGVSAIDEMAPCSLGIVDIHDPLNARLVNCYDNMRPWSMTVSGSYAYVYVSADGSMEVFNLSDLTNLKRVATYATGGDMAVSGDYVYVAIGGGDLQVLGTGPANPQRIASYNISGIARDVAISDRYAYVAAAYGGLQVIDVSNAANPNLVGSYRNCYAVAVAISGNYAYVAAGGLYVLDISDAANPKCVGRYDHGAASDVAVHGDHVYINEHFETGWSGLMVINVSNPANPYPVGSYAICTLSDIAVSGDYVYLADRGDPYTNCRHDTYGLVLIDVMNPSHPRPVGAYPTDSYALGVAVSKTLAYVGSGRAGFQAIDVSVPGSPRRVGGCALLAGNVAVSGNYAYVTEVVWNDEGGYGANEGLHVIDISNPTEPRRVGGNRTFAANAVTVIAGKIFVAAGHEGLVILHEYQPLRCEQIANERDSMRLRVSGPPGVPGRVQRSADLRNWADWLPVNFGEGSQEILNVDSMAARFYRLAVP